MTLWFRASSMYSFFFMIGYMIQETRPVLLTLHLKPKLKAEYCDFTGWAREWGLFKSCKTPVNMIGYTCHIDVQGAYLSQKDKRNSLETWSKKPTFQHQELQFPKSGFFGNISASTSEWWLAGESHLLTRKGAKTQTIPLHNERLNLFSSKLPYVK